MNPPFTLCSLVFLLGLCAGPVAGLAADSLTPAQLRVE